MAQHFIPTDKTTWPPLDTPVLWAYKEKNKCYYIIAYLRHEVWKNGAEELKFKPEGITGYEWECDLDTYPPFAWQKLPPFSLPSIGDSNAN